MPEILFTSLIHLIQHPKDYEGKRVRVIGFACMEFESTSLFISKEHYEHSLTRNGVWLSMELTDRTRAFHEKYVLVEGEFDPKELGQLRLFSGSIKNITRAMEWRLRRGPGQSEAEAAEQGSGEEFESEEE